MRGYRIEPDGSKTIRAKTTGRFSQGKRTWDSTITEAILIEVGADAVASYSSTVREYEDDVLQKTVEVTLEETAVDSDSYSGTIAVAEPDGRTKTHNVTMDSDHGLDIYDDSAKALSSVLSYPASDVDHFGSSERRVAMSLQNGSFEGELTGGMLVGTYTWITGQESEIRIGPSFVAVDGWID